MKKISIRIAAEEGSTIAPLQEIVEVPDDYDYMVVWRIGNQEIQATLDDLESFRKVLKAAYEEGNNDLITHHAVNPVVLRFDEKEKVFTKQEIKDLLARCVAPVEWKNKKVNEILIRPDWFDILGETMLWGIKITSHEFISTDDPGILIVDIDDLKK